MNEVSRTDTELVQAIRRALDTEEFATDTIRRVRQILTPVVPAEGLPPYNFETATEAERWAYDQGREAGHQDGYDEAVTDAVENPDRFAARLREIRP